MSGTRNTRSVLTEDNGTNKTSTHLSTNIIIKVDNYIVGAVQSINISETRQIKMIDEIGTDGHIDSAPFASANISGSCSRVRFQKQRITEAFGRGFIHISAQRLPFDIEIHDFFHVNGVNDKANAIVTTVKNVWIKSLTYDYHHDNWIITDKMDFDAETIYSKMIVGTGNVVQQAVNGQGGTIRLNQYEQEADRGDYRGALDAAGILNAFQSDPFTNA